LEGLFRPAVVLVIEAVVVLVIAVAVVVRTGIPIEKVARSQANDQSVRHSVLRICVRPYAKEYYDERGKATQ
jgi:hypothetical protein